MIIDLPNQTELDADIAAFAAPRDEDPLAPDCATDGFMLVSRRALVRLALVACETATRFQREGIGHDPMAWMLAPRRLFEGKRPLEASLRHEGFMRAVLLHGLELGLDADAAEVDGLTEWANDPAGEGKVAGTARPVGPLDPRPAAARVDRRRGSARSGRGVLDEAAA